MVFSDNTAQNTNVFKMAYLYQQLTTTLLNNDTSLPKPHEHLSCLQYDYRADDLSSRQANIDVQLLKPQPMQKSDACSRYD